MPVAKDIFEPSNPDPIERLARIEGESNFFSLLAGIETGKDTTQDMAALSFARTRGCVPEVLETYVAQSGFWQRPLMSALFAVLCDELHPKEADKAWMRGAVADAFLMVRYGHCKPGILRAKKFKIGNNVVQGPIKHPGTKGKHPFEKGVKDFLPSAGKTLESGVDKIMRGIF